MKPTPGPLPLPTDGYKASTDGSSVFMGKSFTGESGEARPGPTLAPPQVQAGGQAQVQLPAVAPAKPEKLSKNAAAVPAPGFSIK